MRGIEQIPWCYDTLMGISERTGLGRWRRWLTSGSQGQVLEVGSGTGRNLPLYPGDAKVIGLEPAFASLLAARKKSPDTRLVLGSAEDLPFRPNSFDTVVSGLVFCSVPDPMRGLSEVARVLRPSGTLRMLEHVRAKSHWGGRFQDLILPPWKFVTGGCHLNRDTEANVRNAGFQIQPDRKEDGSLRCFSAVPPREVSRDRVQAEGRMTPLTPPRGNGLQLGL